MPPDVAAVAGTAGELALPVLLVLGLAGRFGAAGLSVVNAVAAISLAELGDAVLIYTEKAKRENIRIIYQEPEMLPFVYGDKNRIRQVFINVIDNALKYTNPGGTVRVSAYEDDGFIRVIIKDSGCGIPAEHLPNVKKKFYKANQNVRGNGIGLAVANEIMELHSGSLDVDSEEGMGTTVIITIPTMKKLEMNPELSNTTQNPTATAQVQVVERKQD